MAQQQERSLTARLKRSRLVSQAAIDRARLALGEPDDEFALMAELLRRGLVTAWQIERLQSGSGGGFYLNHYKLLELIGHGAMGQVFLARDMKEHRRVAVKVLPANLATPHAIRRFRREGKMALAVKHRHIVETYELAQHGKTHFLVMELVEGTDLKQYLAHKGWLSPRRTAHIGCQVAMALDHAHNTGIVHRDIKPSNILLSREGRVKLADLGLAKFFSHGRNETEALTASGTLLGTVDYMAPEQAANSKLVDIRSDIYALGCTLYHCLTGQPPFPEGSLVQKVLAHGSAEPESLLRFNRDIPEGLEDLILNRMMAKRPDDRIQRPYDVVQSLKPWAVGSPNLSDVRALQLLLKEEREADTVDLLPASTQPIRRKRKAGQRRRIRWREPVSNKALAIYWAAISVMVLVGFLIAWALNR